MLISKLTSQSLDHFPKPAIAWKMIFQNAFCLLTNTAYFRIWILVNKKNAGILKNQEKTVFKPRQGLSLARFSARRKAINIQQFQIIDNACGHARAPAGSPERIP